MKKLIALMLTAAVVLSLLTGCGANDTVEGPREETQQENAAQSTEGTREEVPAETEPEIVVDAQFVLEYPADMQALGFTEALVMKKRLSGSSVCRLLLSWLCMSWAPILWAFPSVPL